MSHRDTVIIIDESDELANESLVVHPHTQIPEIHIDELMSDAEGGGSENDEDEDTQMLGTNTQDVSPSQILYSAKGILKENKTSYLIAWEGLDPETGKDWKPTWEAKDCPTSDLVATWNNEKKKAKAVEKKRVEIEKRKSKGGDTTSDTSEEEETIEQRKKREKKKQKEAKRVRDQEEEEAEEARAKLIKKLKKSKEKGKTKSKRIIATSDSDAETEYDLIPDTSKGVERKKNGLPGQRLPAFNNAALSGDNTASPPPLAPVSASTAQVSRLPIAYTQPRKSVAFQGIATSPLPKTALPLSDRAAGKQRAVDDVENVLLAMLVNSRSPPKSPNKVASNKSITKMALKATQSEPKLSNNTSSNESVVPDSQALESLSPGGRPSSSAPPLSNYMEIDDDEDEEVAALLAKPAKKTKRLSASGKLLRPVPYPLPIDFQHHPPTSSFDPIEDADSSPDKSNSKSRLRLAEALKIAQDESGLVLIPVSDQSQLSIPTQSTQPEQSQPIINLNRTSLNPPFKPFARPQKPSSIVTKGGMDLFSSAVDDVNGYPNINFDDNFGNGVELSDQSQPERTIWRPDTVIDPSVLSNAPRAVGSGQIPNMAPVDSPIILTLRQQNVQLQSTINKCNNEIAQLKATAAEHDRLVQSITRTNQDTRRLQESTKSLLEINAALQVALDVEEKKFGRSERRMDELSNEYDKFVADTNQQLATKAVNVEGPNEDLMERIEKLEKRNASLEADKDTALEDGEYLRAQYQDASNKAAARGREAHEAESKVKGLERSLDLGLRQRDLFQTSQQYIMQTEIDRLKMESTLLKEESRRTMSIRTKATKWESHVAEEELRMIELMRARRAREEEETKRELEVLERQEAEQAGVAFVDPSAFISATSNEIDFDMGVDDDEGSTDDEDDPFVLECLWRDGNDTKCPVDVESRELLQDHITVVHIHDHREASPTLSELQFE